MADHGGGSDWKEVRTCVEVRTVEQFREFCRSGELQKQFVLLETHRKCLLGKIHKYEKQIECLDYLVFQMKRAADGTRTRGE